MSTSLVKREETAIEKHRRKSLARVTAGAGLFSSVMTLALMAVIMTVVGEMSISLGWFAAFFVVVSTVSAHWFGKMGGKFLNKKEDDS